MKKKIILSICFISSVLWASPSFDSQSPSTNREVRNLGMGNVGVALKGTHDSAVFYNPAGLNDLKKGRTEFLKISAEMSKNALDLVSDVKDLVNDLEDANANNGDRFRVLDDFISNNNGKFRHVRLTVDVFNHVRKNFAVGLLLEEKFNLTVREPAVPEFHVQTTTDFVGYVAGAKGFFDGALQVGVTFKPTVRLAMDEVDEVIDYADTQEDANGDLKVQEQFKNIIENQYFGLGVDVGVKTNFAFGKLKESKWRKSLDPMFGITWQDMGSPSFGAAPGNGQSLNMGLAIHPSFAKIKNAIAVDIRDINKDMPFISKLHMGFETKLPVILAVRGGLSQGYLTGGATLDLWFFKVDGAVYFEEIGVHTRQDGNLRWAIQLGFGI